MTPYLLLSAHILSSLKKKHLIVLSILAGIFLSDFSVAQTITTVAGGIGDNLSATIYGRLNGPTDIAADGVGNIYIADSRNNRIRKVNSSGVITTIAGIGSAGTSGIGGLAIYAEINNPSGIALDAAGNLYVSFNYGYVGKIDATGVLSIIAGTGSGGFSGDGGLATKAQVSYPGAIAFDAFGNIYIADNGNGRVRKIDVSGVITTIAGGGSILGDGGPAIAASLSADGIAVDVAGNLYVADGGNKSIRKINTSGIISTIAGNGTSGFSGDGGQASVAGLEFPSGIAFDAAGNMYISENSYSGARVRKVSPSGVISTIAGNGLPGFSGDGGPAIAAPITYAANVIVDAAGNSFIVDNLESRVRMINPAGIISTIAGNGIANGASGYYKGEGGQALLAQICLDNIAVDRNDNLYCTDAPLNRVRKISSSGIITTIAGNGIVGFSGDGGPALNAELDAPGSVSVDWAGDIFIGDNGTEHIRKVDPGGIITTIAGGGTGGLGDGGPATSAIITVYAIAADSMGNVYVADGGNNRVRKVDANTGIITTIAGGGVLGDGNPATSARLSTPNSVAVDRMGCVYLSDGFGIHKIDRSGVLTKLLAGGWFNVTADSMGNVYFTNRNTIGKIDIYGYVTYIAGNGALGYMGDSGPALNAELDGMPTGIAVDGTGHVFFVNCSTIRMVCCMSNIIDHPPFFIKGATQSLTVCKNSPSVSLDTSAAITDGDIGNTEKWTISSPPAHGSMTGFSCTALSTGGTVMPSGTAYLPDTGYSGTDYFTIKVQDGTDTLYTTITVNIITPPNPGSITGASGVCPGGTITLLDGVAGGVWSSSNGHGTVSPSGVVTGVSAGIDTIRYKVMNACGTTFATKTITINPSVSAGVVKGASSLCVGASIVLSDSVAGGIWSSPSPFVSVASTSGIVIGTAPGTAIVYYIVSTVCGTSRDSIFITVYPVPSAGAISGTTSVCIGNVTNLSDPVTGGTWSSGSTSVARVSGSGVVNGINAGGVVISYTVTNGCGSSSAITIVNVVASSPITNITGHSSVCAGDTTMLHDATPGGAWSSSVPSVASISSSGIVTGIAPGITAISYTASLGCGISVATFMLNVDHPASSGILTGTAALCIGATTFLGTTVSGGTWSNSNSHAVVVPSGIITGMTTGPDTILYTVTNTCGSSTAQHIIGVYPVPAAGVISGASTVCSGDSITLSDAATGGAWNSSNISVATVDAVGLVHGIAGGSVIISYTAATGCGTAAASKSITVNAAAGIITGVTTLCTGGTTMLSDAMGGGTWSSSTPAVASINSSGMVTGIISGTTIISYTVTAGCGISTAYAILTVGTLPVVAAISGSPAVCIASTAMLSDVTPGGVWSSSSTAVAAIGSTGIITGASTGTATISYTVAAPCGSNTVTFTMHVESFPSAGIISGSSSVCAGSGMVLSESAHSGYWTSSNPALAVVGSVTGDVTGLASGVAAIVYSVRNSCGTDTTVKTITVNPLPDAGIISGITGICYGTSATLSDASIGGVWSSSDIAVADIGSGSGIVSGISVGSATISYFVANGCGVDSVTQVVLVNPLPDAGAISGFTELCAGSVDTLAETFVSGTWSTSNVSIASVGMTTGIVNGVSPGTTTIIYSVTNSCGTALTTRVITVNTPDVAAIIGAASLCQDASVIMSDPTPGGTWGSGNNAVAIVDNATGEVTGLNPGTATISYQVSNGCGTHWQSMVINVEQMPSAGSITGNHNICKGTTMVLGESIAGGIWSSGNATLAVISKDGLLLGIDKGTVLISYAVSNSCGSAQVTIAETIMDAPDAGLITGSTTICIGSTSLLADPVSEGVWSCEANDIATITNTGMVKAIASGTTIVSYTVTNTCGTNTALIPITVNQLPYVSTILGSKKTVAGSNTVLSNEIPGGTWTSGNTSIAIVNQKGMVSGVSAGTVTISYTVFNINGCSLDSTAIITVFPHNAKGNIYKIFPNPASTQLTIGWENEPDEIAELSITDMLGRKVYKATIDMPDINGSTVLNIRDIVSGMYIVTIRSANGLYSEKLVVL